MNDVERPRPLTTALRRAALTTAAFLSVGLAVGLTGCRAQAPAAAFEFEAGRYADALDATRDTLRAAGYTIERVDAVSGEITTTERTVAGLATPLASENRSARGLITDTLTNRPRTVRVRFRDAANPDAPPTAQGPIRLEIDAMIWQRVNPGWRVETETTFGNTVSFDPAEARRGIGANAPVPVRMDDEFARVLTKRIADRLAKQSARAQSRAEQPTETGADSSTGSP